MQYRITAPTDIDVTIELPSSKSISNRALILHALSGGKCKPQNLSNCDDTRVMLKALEESSTHIDILAAGTAMRFLTAYLSVTPGTRIISGTARMHQRPIKILVDALRQLGAEIEYVKEEGFPPLKITGTQLHSKEVSLPGSVSSQYISALLMIGPVIPDGLMLRLTGEIISRPYINLTLQLMKDFGAKAMWATEDSIVVYPGGYQDASFHVESDWSAASYWYQIAALCPQKTEITLTGLHVGSHQGDSRGAEVFKRLGINTEFTSEGLTLSKDICTITQLDEDFTDIPDLAQTFVVTCALLDIPFRFTGLQSLRIKETDRISALICELRKLGYVLHAEQDSILYWDGERCTPKSNPVIATYEDHRMAMAFAPVSIIKPHISIADPSVVSKSYPDYWKHLQQAGFIIEEE